MVSFLQILSNILRLEQNGHHFADDILKYIFWNENFNRMIQISLKFVPVCPINNKSTLAEHCGADYKSLDR